MLADSGHSGLASVLLQSAWMLLNILPWYTKHSTTAATQPVAPANVASSSHMLICARVLYRDLEWQDMTPSLDILQQIEYIAVWARLLVSRAVYTVRQPAS